MTTTIKLTQGILKGALKACVAHASKDPSRDHLSGVKIETDGKSLDFIATDGATLCHVSLEPLLGCNVDGGEAWGFLSVSQVKQVLEQIHHRKKDAGVELTIELRSDIVQVGPMPYVQMWKAYREVVDGPRVSSFPPWRQVEPEQSSSGDTSIGASFTGLDPKFLKRLGTACSALGMKTGVRLSTPPSPLFPVRFDGSFDGGMVVFTIMPMRI